MQREKKTYSGPLLEVNFYPVWSDGRKMPSRSPKTKATSAEMQRYNKNCAVKKFIRIVNANFDTDDYFMHPTYSPDKIPQNEDAARRDMINFLRRVKARRVRRLKEKKAQLAEAKEALRLSPGNGFLCDSVASLKKDIKKLSKPLKYAYVMEKVTYKTGKNKGKDNFHFHLFLTGGLDAKEIESMWTNGLRSNCDFFQPEKFGPEAAAKYMLKDPHGAKRFVCSKNMQKSVERVRDGKVSKAKVEKMAKLRVDDRAYWEKLYPGYKLIKCYATFNEFNAHWYVSAVLYKTDGDTPPWDFEGWREVDF